MQQPTDMHRGLAALVFEAYNDLFTQDAPEIDHYRDVIRESGEPALDAGCGPGRLLLRYLGEGLDVDGSDLSPDMLDLCRRKAATARVSPTLYEMSNAELELPRRYRTIFLSGVFGMNGVRADDVTTLERAFAHLEPGGTLAFDAGAAWGNPRVWRRACTSHRFRPGPWRVAGTLPTREGDVTTSDRVRLVDPAEQGFEIDLRYELARDGEIVRTEHRRLVARWYTPNQLRDMLEAAGFADIRVDRAFTDVPASGQDDSFSCRGRRV